jgi:hypothetical protein
MPLDPDKLREVTEKAQTLSKRFDAFIERRMADSDDDDDDDEEENEDELLDPAEEAMRATPGSDLANPDIQTPWYSHD